MPTRTDRDMLGVLPRWPTPRVAAARARLRLRREMGPSV
jgi:hypothetical protein